MPDTDRFLNLGTKVKTSIGELTVEEPSARDLLRIAQALPRALSVVSTLSSEGVDESVLLAAMLSDDAVQDTVFEVLAMFCGITLEQANKLKPTDVLQLLVAVKENLDWEDLLETFFTLVPSMKKDNTSTKKKPTKRAQV